MGRNNLAIMSVAEGKTGTVIIIEHTVSLLKKKRKKKKIHPDVHLVDEIWHNTHFQNKLISQQQNEHIFLFL